MKKYRLIELGDNYPKKLETYASFEEAATAMRNLMGGNRNFFYRIEEVEESIMDKVKSYEDACKETGRLNADTDKEHWAYIAPAHIKALEKLETITAALNEGWKPDWEDIEQVKFCPIFTIESNGLKAYQIYCTRDEVGCAPSCLYFKSRELAEYAAKQFSDLYKQLLIEKF